MRTLYGGEKTPKLSIIVASDKLDKVFPAVTLASTAAIMGWEAELFFTFWGILALQKGRSQLNVSSEYKNFEKELNKAVAAKSIPEWKEILVQGKDTGKLKVYACSTTMGLLGISKEDLANYVDDVVGAAYFLNKAKDSDVNFFIS